MAGVGQVIVLGLGLGGRFVGHKAGRPDLAVRMRVAGSHHGPAVLEDLHVLDPLQAAHLDIFPRPAIHHRANLLAGHARQGQAVVGMVAEHLAQSAGRFGHQQR